MELLVIVKIKKIFFVVLLFSLIFFCFSLYFPILRDAV